MAGFRDQEYSIEDMDTELLVVMVGQSGLSFSDSLECWEESVCLASQKVYFFKEPSLGNVNVYRARIESSLPLWKQAL